MIRAVVREVVRAVVFGSAGAAARQRARVYRIDAGGAVRYRPVTVVDRGDGGWGAGER